jgi:L-ribulokinase
MKYVIGIDYGTDSCRALLTDANTGEEVAMAVKNYPRWAEGKYCNPQANQYRQHPLDYVETLEGVVREVLAESPANAAEQVAGIAFDTTGSTPVMTDAGGTPLALLPAFSDDPDAMFVLWKDHTAIKEADEINRHVRCRSTDYTKYLGGIYSSEWVWSKVLHLLRANPAVRKAACAWTEHCDWMAALLTGNTRPETMLRNRCAAGHKAMWHASWGGLPEEAFFSSLDPLLAGFRSRLYTNTQTGGTPAGHLTREWAERLGLTTNVVVGVGSLDCHAGAVGAGIKPGSIVRVMGTSTCDIIVVPYRQMEGKFIPGICGQVDGSVLPGMIGLEAGQSAFGDIYAWFRNILEWPVRKLLDTANAINAIDSAAKEKLLRDWSRDILPAITAEAANISPADSTLLALDWMNGRRTPDADQRLTGSIHGITLATTAPMMFRALVEATAFGSKAIVDRFIENGIDLPEVIAIGGIAQKSSFVMQILSDVLNRSIKVAKADQACALGAAVFAAVAAGIHPNVEAAQAAMGKGFSREYSPNAERHAIYLERYRKYLEAGAFTEKQLSAFQA